MKPAFKKGFGDLKMRRVRCGDGDKINRIVLLFFAGQHVLPAAVAAVAKSQTAAIGNPLIGPVIQSAGGELKQTVKPSTQSMCRPNLAAVTAANHAPL